MLLVPIPVWQLSLVSWHLTSYMSLFNTFNGRSLFISPAFLISYLHSLLVFIPLFSACIYSLVLCLSFTSLNLFSSFCTVCFSSSLSLVSKPFLSSLSCFCSIHSLCLLQAFLVFLHLSLLFFVPFIFLCLSQAFLLNLLLLFVPLVCLSFGSLSCLPFTVFALSSSLSIPRNLSSFSLLSSSGT